MSGRLRSIVGAIASFSLVASGIVATATPASAATDYIFEVNSLRPNASTYASTPSLNVSPADANPGDGICATAAANITPPGGSPVPECTMMAAIQEANAKGTPNTADTITVGPAPLMLKAWGNAATAGDWVSTGTIPLYGTAFMLPSGSYNNTSVYGGNWEDSNYMVFAVAGDNITIDLQNRIGVATNYDGPNSGTFGFSGKNQTFRNFSRVNSGESAIYVGATSENLTIENGAVVNGQGENYTERGIIVWGGAKNFTLRNVTVDNIWTYGLVFVTNGAVTGNPFTGSRSMAANSPIVSPLVERSTFGHVSGYNNGHSSLVNYGAVTIPDLKIVNNTFKNWSAWPLYLKDATTPNLQIVGNRFSQAVFQKSQGIVLYNVGGTGKVIADNDFCYASTTAQSCYDASVYAPVLGNAGSDQNWSSIYVYDPSNTNNAVVVRDNRIEGGGGSANIYMQSGTAATAMPVYRNTMTGVGGNSTNTSYENGAANQNNVVSYNANSNIRTYSPSSITPDPLGDPCLVEIGAAMSSVGGTAIPNNTPVYIDVFASDAVAAGGDGMGLEQYVGRYSTTYTGTNPTFKMPITGGGDLVFRLQTTNVTTGQTSQMSVTRTKTGPDMCPPSVWVKRGGWFDANGTQTASQADPTSVRTVTFDIMVSERMADSLAANEISFAGSTALNPRVKSLQFLGGNRYRLLAMADSSGTITPSVPANKIKDPSGNWNAASNTNVAPINFAGYTDAAQTQGIAGANIDDVVQYNSPISVTTATPTVSEPGPGSPQTAFTVTTTNRPTSLISFTPVWSGLSAIAGLSPQPAADTVAKAVPNNPSLDAIRPSMTSMQTQTTLQVRPIDNTIVDGTRTVTLGFTIGSTDPEFDGLILETTGSASPATTTVTVNDNDTPIPASGTISVLTNNALNNGVATNTVQATARNSLGQLVSNALVTFATSPAGPTPIPAGWGIRSAVGGTATIAIASTTQGSFTVTAPAATNASASVNFLPGIPPVPVVNPSNGTVVAGTAVSAGTVSPEGVTITAQTSGGSPITVVCNESTHNPKNNVVPAAQTSPFAFTCTPATTLPDLAVVSVTATNIAGTSPAQVVTVHAAPAAPVVSPLVTNPVAGTTTVAGTAKPGSTITVKDGNGNPVTTTPSPCTVDGSGSYSCTIPATTTGPVSVVATDANGDSAPQTATMPVVPPAPGVVPTDGSTVSGTAAPGSTITVTDGSGNPIGTSPSPCLADATTGAYDCALVPPPADGTTIKVTATLAGQPSAPTTLVAQATAPSLAVATADGTNVVGTSSPGATITVTDAGGQPLVTSPSPCVADSSGAFACTLATPLADGAALTVTATKSGQSSQTTATVDVPINASSNGGIVTGTVLPSSAVTVKDADGTTLCTTTANATTGAFSCTPSPVPVDGATLTVLSDPPGAAPAATATIEVDSPVQASSNGTAVTGTAVPGSTVVVKDAAGNPVTTSPSPCVADPTTGAFACTLATPVADGTALTVVSQHSSGTPVYGATPIAVVTPVQATSDGTTVSGIGSPGAAIDVKKNGTTICTTTVALDGTYSCPLSTPLADGDTVSVTSTPTGGGAPSTATIAVDSLITASSSGAVVTGTALPGAVITVKDGNVTLTTTPSPCVADGSGHYACAISPAVPTGTDLTVIGTTGSGQNVQTSITTVEADPILESSSNGTSVIGTAPPGSTITVTDDHGTTVCSTTTAANGTFTCPLNPAVPDGEQLTVSASAGSFPLGTETITTDANITAQSNGSSVTGTTAPGATVEVKDANGTTLCIAQADPVTGNYSCTPSTPPAVGTVITATATDSGGTVLGQTTATVEQALMAAEGAGVVSGIASPGSTITVKDGGGTPVVCTNAPVTAAADGTFSCTLPTSPAPSGPFSVTSTSTGGQVQTVQATPANVTPITASSNGTTVTGTATPGTTVTVTDGTNTLCTATADASGGFSCTLSPAQTDGALLEITQSTGPQTPVTVTVDTFVTASATPTTVTGTAPPGSTVAVTGATATCTNPVPASGVYSCTFSPEPAVGTPVTVTATGAGSVVLGTTTTNVGAPALIAAEGVDGSGDTEITGVTTPGATVVVTDSTSGTPETCTTTAAADGTFSCTFTGVTPSGPYTVEATPAGGGTPVTAPAIPATGSTLDVDSNGTHLVGVGTPGATISVTSPAGVTLTAVGGGPCVADTAGAFNCELSPVQPDGTPLTVAQSSGPSPVSVDVDAFVTAAATTGTVTGTAPAGSVVEVKNGATTVCTIDPVPSTGVYSCAPSPVPAVGDTLTITSTSQNGDPLGVATATATQGLIASEGMSGGNPTVSGSAAPGSAITVTDGVGQPVACTNAPVTANATTGAFDCTLPIGATGPFTVTATSPGAGGLVESAVAASAFNTALNVTSNGVGITGTGTPGATISVSSPAGVTLTAVGGGACVADSVGAFNCVMSPAQPDGAALTIAQSAGPSPVSVEVDAFVTASSAGSSVTGSAAPGSEVTVKAADGTTLCTVDPVPANGIYVCDIPANLHPNDGSVLTVTVTGQGGSPTLAQTTTTVDPLVTASGTGGVITGTAVPGATVAVKNADGTVICTTTADATTGAYACTPSIGLLPSDGDVLTVESTRAGQTSTTTITADAMVDAASDGLAVTGTAPPGATIELTDAAGNPIPTTSPCTANASGMFVGEAGTPLTTGETVFVTATAGGVPTRDAITVDAVATAVSDGSVVTGVAAPGATIELTDAGGNPIPTMPSPCVASSSGSYACVPAAPIPSGTDVTVTATKNGTPVGTVTTTVASGVVATSDGAVITGTAEPGAQVVVRNASNQPICTATADSNGAFACTPAAGQRPANGETVTVVSTDSAGNQTRTPVVVETPMSATSNGATVSGTALPGSTVTVSGPNGPVCTATADSSGAFTCAATTPQADGTVLTVGATTSGGRTMQTTATVNAPMTASGDGSAFTGTAIPGSTITATGTAGSIPLVDVNGGPCVAAANGTFACMPASASDVPVGGSAVTVTATAPSGGPVAATIVNVSPMVSASSSQGDVTGTAVPGATVEVIDPASGTVLCTTTANASTGNFACSPSPAPTAGTQLEVRSAAPAPSTQIARTLVTATQGGGGGGGGTGGGGTGGGGGAATGPSPAPTPAPEPTAQDGPRDLNPWVPNAKLPLGDDKVTYDGHRIDAAIAANVTSTGLEVTTADPLAMPGWGLQVAAVDGNGRPEPLGEAGSVVVMRGAKLMVRGSHYQPGTQVNVFVFTGTTPVLLGTLVTDGDGSLAGALMVPRSMKAGVKTLQVNGLAKSGKVMSVSLGFKVADHASGQIGTRVLFKHNSDKITAKGKKALRALVAQVPRSARPTTKALAYVRVLAQGATPTPAAKALAKARAKALKKFLVNKTTLRGTVKKATRPETFPQLAQSRRASVTISGLPR